MGKIALKLVLMHLHSFKFSLYSGLILFFLIKAVHSLEIIEIIAPWFPSSFFIGCFLLSNGYEVLRSNSALCSDVSCASVHSGEVITVGPLERERERWSLGCYLILSEQSHWFTAAFNAAADLYSAALVAFVSVLISHMLSKLTHHA